MNSVEICGFFLPLKFCVKSIWALISQIMISRKIWELEEFLNLHNVTCQPTVWKNEKFSLTKIFFREINYLVILLVKTSFSRNFCQKSMRLNFRNFHSVCNATAVWKFKNFLSFRFYVKLVQTSRNSNIDFT